MTQLSLQPRYRLRGGGVYVIGSAALLALSNNQTISKTMSGDGGGVFIPLLLKNRDLI